MKKKRIVIVFGAVMTVLLMISSATAINIPGNKSNFEKSDDELKTNEIKNKKENENPKGLCTINIWTYYQGPPKVGTLTVPFVWLRCEDLDNGIVRYYLSGLFGHAWLFGLAYGHTYKINAIGRFDAEIVVGPICFWDYVRFCVMSDA